MDGRDTSLGPASTAWRPCFECLPSHSPQVHLLGESESFQHILHLRTNPKMCPQVYVAGEFVGGADILIQSYTSGELSEMLEAALNS